MVAAGAPPPPPAPTGGAALAAATRRSLSLTDLPEPRGGALAPRAGALRPPPSPPSLEPEDAAGGLPLPEPYKIKMVESITLRPRAERQVLLAAAGYNVFGLRSDEVFIDLLTDSGTSAMSDAQWAGMVGTPQAYAGASSFYTLESVVRDLFGFAHVLPVHQGRAAENVLFSCLVSPDSGAVVPNNWHFDTTEANVLRCGGQPVNLTVPEAFDTALAAPFKGNMDIAALEALLSDKGAGSVPVIMLTATNNSAGGQPVSMDNVRQVSAIARRAGIPLFIDAARFAENAWFIQRWEPGYEGRPLREIVREFFSYADGCTFSGKKEALANVGGLLCCNDAALHETLRNLSIVVEGYPTYGGLACRDLMAMARGLMEATEQRYQDHRHAQIELLAGLLRERGVPIVEPPGGHAVYIDAARFLPHIPAHQFPAQALTAAVYAASGVRGVEIGSSCFGHTNPETGEFVPSRLELMRLALPRRVYTSDHLRYVAAAIVALHGQRDSIVGLRRVYATKLLSHFTAQFQPLDDAPAA
ncbi:tnaA [Scenedesmus sp. PABB004]|nr:tnaA [Scenedesmus sp. PABB004]